MFSLVKKTFTEFSDDDCPRMAAALAYYTAFSLAPLLILAMSVAGLFFDPSDVQGKVQDQISSAVGEDGAGQVKEMLENADKPRISGVASILSLIGLLFGATGVVVQLQTALNDAWEVKPDPEQGGIWNFITKRLLSLGMVLGLGFVLVVSLVLSSLVRAFDQQLTSILPEQIGTGAAALINSGVTLVILTLLFAAIFKVLPDVNVRWSDVLVGAALTAVLFVIGKFALSLYLGSQSMGSSFGAAGSLVLILLWVYYSAMILLFGAEFTQVWANKKGRVIEPEKGAVKIHEKIEPAE